MGLACFKSEEYHRNFVIIGKDYPEKGRLEGKVTAVQTGILFLYPAETAEADRHGILFQHTFA